MNKETKILVGVGAVIAAYLILKPKKAVAQTNIVSTPKIVQSPSKVQTPSNVQLENMPIVKQTPFIPTLPKPKVNIGNSGVRSKALDEINNYLKSQVAPINGKCPNGYYKETITCIVAPCPEGMCVPYPEI
jgi:hypothetical protein